MFFPRNPPRTEYKTGNAEASTLQGQDSIKLLKSSLGLCGSVRIALSGELSLVGRVSGDDPRAGRHVADEEEHPGDVELKTAESGFSADHDNEHMVPNVVRA